MGTLKFIVVFEGLDVQSEATIVGRDSSLVSNRDNWLGFDKFTATAHKQLFQDLLLYHALIASPQTIISGLTSEPCLDSLPTNNYFRTYF